MISKVLAVSALCLLLVQASHGCLNISPKVPQLKDDDGEKYTSQILGILAAQTEKPSDEVRLRFISYGCYCGLGGKGTARDALDKCCQKHDACYDTFHSNNALLGNYGLEYTYTFDFKSDKATCVADQAKDKLIKCGCDLRLGECMKEHWDSYSDDYKGLRFTKDWETTCKKDPTESENSLLDKLPHMNKL